MLVEPRNEPNIEEILMIPGLELIRAVETNRCLQSAHCWDKLPSRAPSLSSD